MSAAVHPAPAAGVAVVAGPRFGLGSTTQIVAALAVMAAGLYAATHVNGYYVFILANVALLAIVGSGLNVLQGLTGQVSFGHVGFYAIGAYAVAILTTRMGLSFWAAWPLGALLAGAVGGLLALPALRVKGPYLAMVTIAFGLIVEHTVIELRGLTGGQNGIMGIASVSLPLVGSGEKAIASLAIVTAGACLASFAWLSHGTWGAAMRAVRDSETAAESIGIDPLTVKTVAFALSAVAAGLAGGLFAPLSGFVTPSTFGFSQSILFVLVVVIGGLGSVAGPLVGAVVVALLPELLSSLEEYRLLFFGAMLLVVLWVAPDGAMGLWRKLVGRIVRVSRRGPAVVGERAIEPSAPTSSAPGATDPRHATGNAAPRALVATGLSMQFGGVRAVADLSFATAAGRITSLIGPNGAGKTTALNMLSGFYVPTSGGFRLGDQTLQGLASHAISRHGVARTYQTSQLFGSLGVADNVALGIGHGRLGPLFGARRFRSAAARNRAAALLDYCGYRGRLDTPAADLAHVDKRLVEIARALATEPEFLLLDEPAAGLSREDKQRLASLLQRIAASGVGVLAVEHDMELVMSISHHIVVLDAGRHLAAGTPAAIQADPAVRKAYLGEALQPQPSTPSFENDGRVVPPMSSRAAGEMPGVDLLVIRDVATGYGAEPVLHGIELRVRRGEVVSLLGANGAGKSTLMRSLAGLHRPVSGSIALNGEPLNRLAAELISRRGLVLVPEGRQVFPELTVLDNIRLGGFRHEEGRDARVEEMFVRFPRLQERRQQRAGSLSGGEQQMLAVARGLMAKPQILLLDEPSLGLAPKIIAELFAALDTLRREGLTILLVDQMAALALALADRAYVIDGGRIVAQGTATEIASDGELARAYLGSSATTAAEQEAV